MIQSSIEVVFWMHTFGKRRRYIPIGTDIFTLLQSNIDYPCISLSLIFCSRAGNDIKTIYLFRRNIFQISSQVFPCQRKFLTIYVEQDPCSAKHRDIVIIIQ